MEIAKNSKIKIFGVTFNGLMDIKKYAIEGTPKDGVFVGDDSKLYPCFDRFDYANENRFYWNFVFAKSKEELDDKLQKLKSMSGRCNYCKLTTELHPMIYFEGDTHHPLEVTEGEGVELVTSQHKFWG